MGLGVLVLVVLVGSVGWAALAAARGRRPRAVTRAGRRALALAAVGIALTAAGSVAGALADVSIGELHLLAVVAFLGLVALAAGGVAAALAIVRRGERSASVYAVVPLAAVALVLVVLEVATGA